MVEDLSKSRQPMPSFDAVYFIQPCKESVDFLIKDFENERKYKYVHIFFTDGECSGSWNKIEVAVV